MSKPVIHVPDLAEASDEAYEVPKKRTVMVDFDGVIHSYVSGWQGSDVIPDPPVVDVVTGKSSIEWLTEVATEYEVVILTTRARYPQAEGAIRAWLREYGFEGAVEITCEKGPALLYVDDRGWRFRGTFPSLRTIRYARPWRTGDPRRDSVKDTLAKGRQKLHALEQVLASKNKRLRQLSTALILEILRDEDSEDVAAFLKEHEDKAWEKRIELAREVAGR